MESYLEKIKIAAIPIIESYDLVFYDIEESDEYGINTIRVFVDSKVDLSVDIDVVTEITKKLIDVVNDDLPDGYFLEVSSLGIERVLKTPLEVEKALGSYVYIELNKVHEQINLQGFNGYLKEISDDLYKVEVNIKGRKKNIEVKKENVTLIRLAVKF